MSSFRISPSPSSIQLAPSIEIVSNTTRDTILAILRNSIPIQNARSDEFNMIIRVSRIFALIVGILSIAYIALILTKRVRDKYNISTQKQVRPIITLKKAKCSPSVGSINTHPILPSYTRLDGSETGKNIMVRFRGPINTRFETSQLDNETRITIISVMDNSAPTI